MENKCNGRCEECNINQRTYCAAQMAYYAQQEIAEVKAMISTFSKSDESEIVVLREKECTIVNKIEEDEA